MAIDKMHQCVHYDVNTGGYVDCKIDQIFFGLCIKCFNKFRHKKGVTIIRYVVNGVKLAPPVGVPF